MPRTHTIPLALLILTTLAHAATTALLNRDAIAYNPTTHKTYAIDQPHNAVLILNAAGTITHVTVGTEPEALATSALTGHTYIANSGTHSISVLDRNDRVIATIPTAARPYALALDDAAHRLYVSNTFSNKLTILDTTTNTATNLQTGAADALLVDPVTHNLILLGYESDTLTLLNTHTDAARTMARSRLPGGALHLWSMALLGRTLYVTHVQDASIQAIDLDTQSITQIETGAMPSALAADPTHNKLYAANYAGNSVTLIDATNNTATATIALTGHPQALAVDARKQLLYVAQPHDNIVTVIDLRTNQITASLQAGHFPCALAVDTTTHKVYAANIPMNPTDPSVTTLN